MTVTIRQEETGRGGMMMSVSRVQMVQGGTREVHWGTSGYTGVHECKVEGTVTRVGGGGTVLHLVATHSWVENAALWRQ